MEYLRGWVGLKVQCLMYNEVPGQRVSLGRLVARAYAVGYVLFSCRVSGP